MKLSERLAQKLKNLPDEPGCYMMRDAGGRIIYVGKAVSLRKRVQSYFRASTFRKAEPKLRGLIKSVSDLDVIVLRNEADALITEGRLIKEYKPRYNSFFKDDKRFMLIRADMNTPYPTFSLCRLERDDGALYFGPFVSSTAVRTAVEYVVKKFGLRQCKPRVPDAGTYKHCLADILRFCSAPCVGKISERDYMKQFEEACEFLRGRRLKYLREISEEMTAAAERRDYEKAARLRDLLRDLKRATARQARMPSSDLQKRTEAIAGIRELKKALNLRKTPRVIEGFDISNISGTLSVASMVCAIDGIPVRNRYRRYRIKGIDGIDDAAMIREVVTRRTGRLEREGRKLPDLIMVDGGITQLNAGVSALAETNAGGCEIVGLAKRYEEIYVPGLVQPVRLERDSSGLKVLRRLRDEAHRFALEYHRNLRNKLIRDSLLDDIPGIGPSKKKSLLSEFGSVRRLAVADEDSIASVSGIGYKLALEIKKTLEPLLKD